MALEYICWCNRLNLTAQLATDYVENYLIGTMEFMRQHGLIQSFPLFCRIAACALLLATVKEVICKQLSRGFSH